MHNNQNNNHNPPPFPHHSHTQSSPYYPSHIDNNLSFSFPQSPPSSSQHHAQHLQQQNQQQHPGGGPLSSHQRASGSGRSDTTWPCLLDGCNKIFAREADLKRHQRTTKSHSIPGSAVNNPCPLCEANFTRSDAMRRHLKSRHQGRTPETLNTGDTSGNGPSSSNISSGGSSSRGGARRAYSPSEETSELSASDSEQQPYHHHQQTSSIQQPYASSSSRNPVTSSNYYSSPPIAPAPAAAGGTSSNSGMHQNASNNSHSHNPQVVYQGAVSYEIQHALSSPRQSASSPPAAAAHHHSSTSSSSSRRDISSPTHSHFPMHSHSQQAVSMSMENQPAHSSYHPYTTTVQNQEQYPPPPHTYHQPYPGFTSSSGYPPTGGNVYANPYRSNVGGYMVNGMPWKAEDGGMGDGRGGISPSRQSGGLAALAMHASRIRPMSPLSPGKAKTSTKSELENALGPHGVYRR